MRILLVAPYYTGSHAAWARGYAQYSRHQVDILNLPGRFWKWRMHGGAVTLARKFLASDVTPDLILVTDMLDLTTFLALTRRRTATIPTAIYFHENQLTYPWSPTDRDIAQKRDKHYGFINYISAMAADVVLFNSRYHQESFLAALPKLLNHFPDYKELNSVKQIREKSQAHEKPLILWGHRWEHDKGPKDFFKALTLLSGRGFEFDLAVLGENFSRKPNVFLRAKKTLANHIVQFGYVETFEDYARWLWQSDILPVTSNQDFFGVSVVEAIYCDCFPLLPKRLAYPYLIPTEYQAQCLYDDFDDLVARLTEAIINIEQTRQFSLRSVVARYDWQEQSKLYDAFFLDLTNK
jgi:glycosyltransferase involved in cell wall biosynthesis